MSTNVVVDRLRARRCGKHRTEPALVGPPYKLYRPLNWQEVHCWQRHSWHWSHHQGLCQMERFGVRAPRQSVVSCADGSMCKYCCIKSGRVYMCHTHTFSGSSSHLTSLWTLIRGFSQIFTYGPGKTCPLNFFRDVGATYRGPWVKFSKRYNTQNLALMCTIDATQIWRSTIPWRRLVSAKCRRSWLAGDCNREWGHLMPRCRYYIDLCAASKYVFYD